jgi:hypothetical protein
VVSRKPPSEVDRMPGDYEQPRKQQPAAPDDFGAVLTLTPLDATERDARTARALAVLRSYGAEDLAPMLGLVDLPEAGPHVSGPINVACPQCAVPAGTRCISITSGDDLGAHHRGRQRRAAEAAATRTETCHKDGIEKEERRG